MGRATATSRSRGRDDRRGGGAMGPWQCYERHCRGGVPRGRRLGPVHTKPATQPRVRGGHARRSNNRDHPAHARRPGSTMSTKPTAQEPAERANTTPGLGLHRTGHARQQTISAPLPGGGGIRLLSAPPLTTSTAATGHALDSPRCTPPRHPPPTPPSYVPSIRRRTPPHIGRPPGRPKGRHALPRRCRRRPAARRGVPQRRLRRQRGAAATATRRRCRRRGRRPPARRGVAHGRLRVRGAAATTAADASVGRPAPAPPSRGASPAAAPPICPRGLPRGRRGAAAAAGDGASHAASPTHAAHVQVQSSVWRRRRRQRRGAVKGARRGGGGAGQVPAEGRRAHPGRRRARRVAAARAGGKRTRRGG